jgi:hypothetical protein
MHCCLHEIDEFVALGIGQATGMPNVVDAGVVNISAFVGPITGCCEPRARRNRAAC